MFTYSATIGRVIDGDTLVVALEFAPGAWLEEKLRLRGLDCPEVATSEGKLAKHFSGERLPPDLKVTVSTTKPDKYDRYLADVLIPVEKAESLFLNNVLLENGYAVRKDAWEFGDWGI